MVPGQPPGARRGEAIGAGRHVELQHALAAMGADHPPAAPAIGGAGVAQADALADGFALAVAAAREVQFQTGMVWITQIGGVAD